MNVVCQDCGALHWADEKLKASTRQNIIFGSCCRQGKIQVALPQRPPPTLWRLFTGLHPASDNFFANIRQFNSALAFVSMGSKHVELPAGHGPYLYKIGGEVYHRSGDLAAAPGEPRQYAQLWVYDPQSEDQTNAVVNERMGHAANTNCDRPLMRELTGVLQEHHAYAPLYKQIWEVLRNQPVENVAMAIRQNRVDDPRRHPGRYNRPTNDELALIVPDNYIDKQRDIVVHLRGGGIEQMDSWNPAYACLHYVLLYPHGEHGFQRHIPIRNAPWVPGLHPRVAARQQADQEGSGSDEDPEDEGGQGRRTISELQYYAYILFPREKFTRDDPMPAPEVHFSALHRAGRLFQQFLVDIWAMVDQSRLTWFRMNQDTIRAEIYRGVVDARHDDNLEFGGDIGTILPSSYYGGSRQMLECYQDAMAIARHLGAPQLFITMTANPNWPEITNELLPGQTASDLPDLAV